MDSVPDRRHHRPGPRPPIGTDAFQEADIRGITMPITKHNYLVTNADDIPRVIAEAFHIAATGRPGPVLVDISKDALQARTTFSWPPRIDLPGYRPVTRPHSKQIREAARLIAQAERPILYVGGGVIRPGASDELRRFVELTQIPVVTTLMARGALPDSHPLHLGMPGMHGSVAAVTGLQKSDLLITLGARFDDRVTGQLSTFAPEAKVIHADIDPAEISKNRMADVPIVGDCHAVLTDLIAAVDADIDAGRGGDYAEWRERSPAGSRPSRWATPSPRRTARPAVRHRAARRDRRARRRSTSPASASTRCGPRSSSQYERPNAWLNSGGLGTMGYAVPAAMGAKVGEPTAPCGRSTATAASR